MLGNGSVGADSVGEWQCWGLVVTGAVYNVISVQCTLYIVPAI